MDRDTIGVYEARAAEWRDQREARFLDRVALLAEHITDHTTDHTTGGAVVADLGCGAGLHLPHLPRPAVALDAALAMVRLARDAAPDVPGVRADLALLPFRRGTLGGAWARASYLHLARGDLPWALMELHHALAVGAPAHLTMMPGTGEGPFEGDEFAGRFFARWESPELTDVLVGAGFTVVDLVRSGGTHNEWIHVLGRRERTLPDTVGRGMRLLVCGLNPSLRAADAGVGFATPGNRFWPAALAAGLVTRDRDARHAYVHHRIGMTDLVKRASVGAKELTRAEYRDGTARVERLVGRLQPGAVCFVGLAGWRAAVDRRAVAGVQPDGFGGAPAYVMPSTSGLNARTPVTELADHLRAAVALAG